MSVIKRLQDLTKALMLKKLLNKNSDRYLARWVVFAFDLSIVLLSYLGAYVTRHNFTWTVLPEAVSIYKIVLVCLASTFGFLVTRSYTGIIRHTSLRDGYNIFRSSAIIAGILLFVGLFAGSSSILFIPRSILLIQFLLSVFMLIGSRIAVKVVYQSVVSSQTNEKRTKVLIYGAGASGMITKNTLKQDATREYDILGFIDDNPYKIGKTIEGVMVYGFKKIFENDYISKLKPDQLIISIQGSLPASRKKEIVEAALHKNVEIKIVPPVEHWIQGELSTKQIKHVKIENLLERDPIVFDNVNIRREFKGKNILVTGAAGSIGSEISRQLLHYGPAQIILLDQAESSLYDLEQELKNHHPNLYDKAKFVIADVTNIDRMHKVFRVYQPEVVFHAAAYKHVPLMEDNPYEAVSVNVFGTQIVADLSCEYGIEKFVMVSTDKAVNPTNVMGATKRTAEIYTQSLTAKKQCKTQFVITRFGNVLGSNGSVIPLFRKQIESGGPITITHRDITRYFMTIPEACNLVLEAGAMANGGEIFVFDMGESVKIYDLARKMIKLSGLKLGKDIEIVEVGLRPGEKLYEELLAVQENTKATHHPKILVADVIEYEHKEVSEKTKKLKVALESGDNLELVKKLKAIVPEFISNNSIFASLDLKKIANE
jgi:FlaA1/EpsC-like NDP-sugar epimerase